MAVKIPKKIKFSTVFCPRALFENIAVYHSCGRPGKISQELVTTEMHREVHI